MAKVTRYGKGGASVMFSDHSDIVLTKLAGALGAAANDVAEVAVEAVQDKILYGYHDVHGNPPHTEIVDTGKLFDSIEAKVERQSSNAYQVTVGAGVPYAKYVHEGTSKLKGRPFITDGMQDAKKDIQNAIVKALKSQMKD